MPYSTSIFKNEIRCHLLNKYPCRSTGVIDIGAGAGAYFDLLGDYYTSIDAIEVWEPYVTQFEIDLKYRRVFKQEALTFFQKNPKIAYDVAILGDVLEHFAPADAVALLEHCMRQCSYVMVVVPFGCEQDEVLGNRYERHLQPDLNFDIMEHRYGAHLELLMHGFHCSDREYEIAVYQRRFEQRALGTAGYIGQQICDHAGE